MQLHLNLSLIAVRSFEFGRGHYWLGLNVWPGERCMGITVWRSLPYALYALSKTSVDQHINTLGTLISHSWQTYEIFHFSSHLWSNGRWWSEVDLYIIERKWWWWGGWRPQTAACLIRQQLIIAKCDSFQPRCETGWYNFLWWSFRFIMRRHRL